MIHQLLDEAPSTLSLILTSQNTTALDESILLSNSLEHSDFSQNVQTDWVNLFFAVANSLQYSDSSEYLNQLDESVFTFANVDTYPVLIGMLPNLGVSLFCNFDAYLTCVRM